MKKIIVLCSLVLFWDGSIGLSISDIVQKNITIPEDEFYYDYKSCVKGIWSRYSSKYPGYNIMVFYESNGHRFNLHGVIFDSSSDEYENCNGYAYHVWAFECGWFENTGSRGFENWCYTSNNIDINSKGNYITFHKRHESTTKC
jgi:hypothetical protein